MAFIMITLAFAQMMFFLAVSLRQFGGDDGLPVPSRSDFGVFSLADNTTLYYATFAALLLTLALMQRLVHSRFGMVLRGCKSNERRMGAMGFPTLRYKLAAYVISARCAWWQACCWRTSPSSSRRRTWPGRCRAS